MPDPVFLRQPDRECAQHHGGAAGSSLLIIGGYLSFVGIEGKARFHGTPVEAALAVTVGVHDDRAEYQGRPIGRRPVGHLDLVRAAPTRCSRSAATAPLQRAVGDGERPAARIGRIFIACQARPFSE